MYKFIYLSNIVAICAFLNAESFLLWWVMDGGWEICCHSDYLRLLFAQAFTEKWCLFLQHLFGASLKNAFQEQKCKNVAPFCHISDLSVVWSDYWCVLKALSRHSVYLQYAHIYIRAVAVDSFSNGVFFRLFWWLLGHTINILHTLQLSFFFYITNVSEKHIFVLLNIFRIISIN